MSAEPVPVPGPAAADVLRLADPGRELAGVRLLDATGVPADRREFGWRGGQWELRLPELAARRLEYRLELRDPGGGSVQVCDPGNPKLAAGPFGAKSVLELPGYRTPAWLDATAPPGRLDELLLPSRGLRSMTECLLWTAGELPAGRPAPLLVVHDGVELAEYGGLPQLLAVATGCRRLPPLRAALLAPVRRDEHYSASAVYARALALGILPALQEAAPATVRVGLGASLGAVAMLHAHRSWPGQFGALFLQSGSFFTAQRDARESGYARFRRIARFVTTVARAAPGHPSAVPAVLTCGAVEPNLANNRQLARSLTAQGYRVRFVEWPDGHNWVSWRDCWDPHLVDLVAAAAGAAGPGGTNETGSG